MISGDIATVQPSGLCVRDHGRARNRSTFRTQHAFAQVGRFRHRIVEERLKRAEFFKQLPSLRGIQLHKLEYTITNCLSDTQGLKGSTPSELQEREWAASDLADVQKQQWARQTGAHCHGSSSWC